MRAKRLSQGSPPGALPAAPETTVPSICDFPRPAPWAIVTQRGALCLGRSTSAAQRRGLAGERAPCRVPGGTRSPAPWAGPRPDGLRAALKPTAQRPSWAWPGFPPRAPHVCALFGDSWIHRRLVTCLLTGHLGSRHPCPEELRSGRGVVPALVWEEEVGSVPAGPDEQRRERSLSCCHCGTLSLAFMCDRVCL